MKAIDGLQKRKDALVKKLETLRKEKVSENEFKFLGGCGKLHSIKTDLNKETHGVLSGQFIYVDGSDELLLCVGVGKGCEVRRAFDNLWFLRENQTKGLSYVESNSFKELEVLRKAKMSI